MGRHRAEPGVRRRGRRAENRVSGPQRSTELLGWGIFISGTTAVCLLWAELPVSITAGTSALLLAAFAAAWYASRTPVSPQPRVEAAGALTVPAGEVHAVPAVPGSPSAGRPAPAADLSVEDALRNRLESGAGSPVNDGHPEGTAPVIPLAPGAAREFLNTPIPGSAGQASRWTRTFGPPDTGSLPLQPYIPSAHPQVKTADSERQDRRQRSHSSL